MKSFEHHKYKTRVFEQQKRKQISSSFVVRNNREKKSPKTPKKFPFKRGRLRTRDVRILTTHVFRILKKHLKHHEKKPQILLIFHKFLTNFLNIFPPSPQVYFTLKGLSITEMFQSLFLLLLLLNFLHFLF